MSHAVVRVPSHRKKGKDRARRGTRFFASSSNNYNSLDGLTPAPVREVHPYVAPDRLNTSVDPNRALRTLRSSELTALTEDCPICMEAFKPSVKHSEKVVEVTTCKHKFHRHCIKSALEHCCKCPVCRKHLTPEPQGRCPSGTMSVDRIPCKCEGFDDATSTISITYSLKGGKQKSYHPHPGKRFGGTSRNAYIPDNAQGRELLERLKYAWLHGLTFTVGTSLTTGRSNVIVWSSIHHKTCMSGGISCHGFPDGGYFLNCHEELDGLGVPKAEDCRSV